MADKLNETRSRGFDEYATKQGKVKDANEIGITAGKWPSKDEMRKIASGSADVARTPGQFFDPAYYDPLLFFIQHRDRRELNFRLRHAYEYDPIVGNLIDLHRTMPLSSYNLVCRDKTVEREFSDFAESIELLNLSSYILGDWFLLGEAVVFKNWDDYNKVWKDITLIPPEKVELRRNYLTKQPIMLLHVDSELKRLVNSSDPVDQAQVKMMDPDLVEKIRTQERIALPPHQAFHFANKTSHSDLRGTSILKRALYALLMKYKIRMLHNTYLDRGAFPLKVFKVGDAQSKWVPNRSHFEALRNMLAQAATDPDFALIYHYGLQIEYHGTKDKWENLIPHYDWCDKEIMISLFANDALLQSKGTTFSNSNVSVRVLMSRYQMIRSQVELLWKNQIFRPMAEAREYWVPDSTGRMGNAPMKQRNGKLYYLDVPNFKWAKLNLLDDTAQKQFLMRLYEKNVVPHKLVAELFDSDSKEWIDQIKAEEGTVIDPAYVEVKKKAAQMDKVMPQVLLGRKSAEWVLPEETPEDAAKRRKQTTQDPNAAGAAPNPGGSPVPAKPPVQPAPAMPAKPAVPGAPAVPGSPMPGTPPEPTGDNPNAGVRQSPI